MRKFLAFFSVVLLYSIGSIAFGVGFLKFEREFSGKGASGGFFGKDINVTFDAEGSTYVSDSQNRLIQKISPEGDFLNKILMVDGTIPVSYTHLRAHET